MSANVIFTLDGFNITMQISKKDKMRDICQQYATRIGINFNSLLFLYKGKQINFEFTFKGQANFIDKIKNEMKIFVYKKNNDDNIIKNNNLINPLNTNNKIGNNIYYGHKNILKNIKSIFFTRIIFSNLNERKKLDIMKYNKNLQKILNIKLIHYKFLSGKYIIYETKGKGKEYYGENDTLYYEGEYSHGKKNGKIKSYYYDGKLEFEGLYVNGRKNGKGKEYYHHGNLRFEGEYLNGVEISGKLYDPDGEICNIEDRNGIFKEYDYEGALEFEGEYLNGEKNGKGKEYDDLFDKVVFEGEYLKGKRNGKGKKYSSFDSKLEYEGEYLNGLENGNGKEYNYDGTMIFEGIFKNGKRWSGKGYDGKNNIVYEIKYGKGLIKDYQDNKVFTFEGEYLNGEKNGKGKEYYFDGKLKFEGQFLEDQKNGKGKEYDDNGNLIFEGEFLYNHRLKGSEYHKGKLVFEGEYLFNKKWNGKVYDENGNLYELIKGNGKVKEYSNKYLIFEGEYLNGKRNGKGKEYHNGKLIFDGEYLNGKRNGKGKEYNFYNDGLIFEGEYLKGEKNGKGKEYDSYTHKLIFEG